MMTCVAEYGAYLAAIGRPASTRELRRNQLRYMAKAILSPPAYVTTDDLLDWFAAHWEWAAETRRSYRACLRGFFGWLHHAGIIPADPAVDLPPMPRGHSLPRPTPDPVWRAALAAADPRTTLILRLAAEAGLRRAEIAQVHTRDVVGGPGDSYLLVHGKGARERLVPVTDELAAQVAAHPPGWVFPNREGGYLTPAWVGALASRVLPDGWTLHTLRHRFATRAYHGTHDLRAVQRLLGHASVATTEKYTLVDDAAMRAAMTAAVA